MKARLLGAFALLILSAPPVAAASACIDLSHKGQFTFTGMLRNKVFAGPPNFQDIRKGDASEPAYVLELDTPQCARGGEGIADGTSFQAIQLFNPKDVGEIHKNLQRFTDSRVRVAGVNPFGAQTGHHHEPVVMEVVAISPKRDLIAEHRTARPPRELPVYRETAQPKREIAAADYGSARPEKRSFSAGDETGQTAVQAFYSALAAGDGYGASKLVVPEKRGRGHYSAGGMTRFYGSLRKPLRLRAIAPVGANRYRVRYAFDGAGGTCDGEAIVFVKNNEGSNLISGIRALNGC